MIKATMAIQLPVITNPAKAWRFIEPLSIRQCDDDSYIIIHPDSGSWAALSTAQLSVFLALVELERRNRLDSIVGDANPELLNFLYQRGLVIHNGGTVWQSEKFDYTRTRPNTLILKLVGFCDLACTYCYDFRSATYSSKLDASLAKKAIRQAIESSAGHLNILFHGGEPLLAFDLLQELTTYAEELTHQNEFVLKLSIQTNGTRLSVRHVEYFIEHGFSVGLSLDGPASLNDVHRIDHKGAGSFERIMDNLQQFPLLVERAGILTTVTSTNVEFLPEIAEYFRICGFRKWDTAIFQKAGRGESDLNSHAPCPDKVIASFFKLLDDAVLPHWAAFEVRPILHFLRNVLSYRRHSMCLRNGCCGASTDLLSISADGSIEACDCIKDPDLRLGHMQVDDLDAVLSGNTAQYIRSRSTANLLPCRTCDWRVLCGGTCLAKAGAVNAVDDGECRIALAMFPEILKRLSRSKALEKYAIAFN